MASSPALAIVSKYSEANTRLGEMLTRQGDHHRAVEYFRKAILADPRNDQALESLIGACLEANRCAEAVALAREWVRSRPESVLAWTNLARLQLIAGDASSARQTIARAVLLNPSSAALREALAALTTYEQDSSRFLQTTDAAGDSTDAPLPFLRPLKSADAATADRSAGSTDPPVVWVGPLLGLCSYSIHSRQSVVWLREAGVRVEAVSVGSTADSYLRSLDLSELKSIRAALTEYVHDGVFIMHHAPATANDPDCYRSYKWRRPDQLAYVALTAFETDHLPPHWVAPLNRMDEVWCQSIFNMHTFAESGVKPEKLKFVGCGIDLRLYAPELVEPLTQFKPRRFMFLSVFQWHSRKGWPILLEAFARTFSRHDDVCLVIKTSPTRSTSGRIDDIVSAFLHGIGLSRDACAPILVLEQPMSDAQVRSLYRTADAFVLPTRGEGWGIPFHEAMAFGLPTIGTRWGGQLTFMDDSNSFLVNSRGLVEADEEMIRFNAEYAGLRYADPDPEHLAQIMRRVYEHPEEARAVGQKARRDIIANWSRERYIERLRSNCRSIYRRAEGRRIVSPAMRTPLRQELPPILMHGPALDPCGYAHDFRNLLLGLRQAGVGVHLDHQAWNARDGLINEQDCADVTHLMNPSRPAGFYIAIENSLCPPPEPNSKAFRVVRTFWETDRYPASVAARLKEADQVWTAGNHNVESLVRAGIARERIRVLPVSLPVERYGPHVAPLGWADRDLFTFLACFDVSLRKGWDVLLRAFFGEFAPGEKVRLVLNVHSSSGAERAVLKEHIKRWARRFAGRKWLDGNERWLTPYQPIVCLPQDIHGDDMPRFYRSGDAYVMPSRGEGWGIPAMEAMASGIPVIATAWGGHMDYMDESTAFLVPYALVPVCADACRESPLFAGQMWAEPDAVALGRLMRRVKENPREAAARALAGAKRVQERYNRAAVASLAIGLIKEIRDSTSYKSATRARSVRRRIVWEGCQLFRSSLALVNRELCIRLASDDRYNLSLIPSEPQRHNDVCHPRVRRKLESLFGRLHTQCDVYVRHGWPPDFRRPAGARKFVMIQPWEFGRVPKDWVSAINTQVDELWVPSRHVFETYVFSGVDPEKVWLVPNGVDLNIFKPEGQRLELPTRKNFRFLFVGGTIWRKGIDVLLKAWCVAFGPDDDVCLVIKDMGQNSFYRGQCATETIRNLAARRNAPEVIYIADDMSQSRIAALYRACNCLVLPYRGEGFGLPVAEAAASGLPVIVTRGGATDDFVPMDAGFFIDARRVGVRLDGDCAVEGWVLEPDVRSLAEQMMLVFRDEQERTRRAHRAMKYVRGNFSWDSAVQAVKLRLECLCAEST